MSEETNKFLSEILKYTPSKEMKFSDFIGEFMENPKTHLQTSSSIVLESIRSKGYKIISNNGTPAISYNVFTDPFTDGVNAIYGQEKPIKDILHIIDSLNREAGPNRGLVLVGPPASGKTNIVDIISRAVEDYVKRGNLQLYTFAFKFESTQESSKNRPVYIRSLFNHNPLLLLPILLNNEGNDINPRQQVFDKLLENYPDINIPMFYKEANLDKKTLDIIEALINSPKNTGKTLFEILEEYVVIYRLEYSSAQSVGISNIDKMGYLTTSLDRMKIDPADMETVSKHAPELSLMQYKGSLVSSNRGILHIHDAFGIQSEANLTEMYKPLLMLFGSGKVNIESTQVNIDNISFLTTNLEEIETLESFMSSLKIIDRIEKIPVNYLINTNAEMDLLKRDAKSLGTKYDIDPNFFKIAAYYSVMTRLSQPKTPKESWDDKKKAFYQSLSAPQKLFIYASKNTDMIKTLTNLPKSNKFVNEAKQLGIDIYDPETYKHLLYEHPAAIDLKECGLFTEDDLKLIDDEFKEHLINENFPEEGNSGISTRQMQNIIRDVVLSSKNNMLSVPKFLQELDKIMDEGFYINSWAKNMINKQKVEVKLTTPAKATEDKILENSVQDFYGDAFGLTIYVGELYDSLLKNELTISITDRNPDEIEADFRKYIQHVLLDQATLSKSQKHIMVPRYTYIDKITGERIDEPNYRFMSNIENIILGSPAYTKMGGITKRAFRKEISNKYHNKVYNKIIEPTSDLIIDSSDDGLLEQFSKEYKMLLSNRRVNENINVEELKNLFYIKQNSKTDYIKYDKELRNFCEKIISNMKNNFGYSKNTALEAIIYAIDNKVIDLKNIIQKDEDSEK
jgi:predicted Ser/Thr protein kinase